MNHCVQYDCDESLCSDHDVVKVVMDNYVLYGPNGDAIGGGRDTITAITPLQGITPLQHYRGVMECNACNAM